MRGGGKTSTRGREFGRKGRKAKEERSYVER